MQMHYAQAVCEYAGADLVRATPCVAGRALGPYSVLVLLRALFSIQIGGVLTSKAKRH